MTVLEKVEYLMSKNGINKRQLSIRAEIPYSTISNLWVRGSDSMRLPTFRTICDFFDVTMDSMAYDDEEIVYKKDIKAPENSPSERAIIEAFRSADEIDQEAVRRMLGVSGKNNELSEVSA